MVIRNRKTIKDGVITVSRRQTNDCTVKTYYYFIRHISVVIVYVFPFFQFICFRYNFTKFVLLFVCVSRTNVPFGWIVILHGSKDIYKNHCILIQFSMPSISHETVLAIRHDFALLLVPHQSNFFYQISKAVWSNILQFWWRIIKWYVMIELKYAYINEKKSSTHSHCWGAHNNNILTDSKPHRTYSYTRQHINWCFCSRITIE